MKNRWIQVNNHAWFDAELAQADDMPMDQIALCKSVSGKFEWSLTAGTGHMGKIKQALKKKAIEPRVCAIYPLNLQVSISE